MRSAHRVLLMAPSLRSGGMERLVSILLRGFDRDRVRPELALLHRIDENEAYRSSIPPDVPIHDLGKRARTDAARLTVDLARRLGSGRYDAAIGFMTYPNLMLLAADALARRHVPIVATEHVTPDALGATRGKRVQLVLARPLYRRARRLVAVSEGMRQAFVDVLRLPLASTAVIHNPFDPDLDTQAEAPVAHPWLTDGGPTLVAVGRLVPQKAYPVLLDALAIVRRSTPARLVVFGEGPLGPALQARARELGLTDSVDLAGFVANPFGAMRAADAYVLSSDWEGFPFVLVEASRAGAAIVSTDCPFGADEVVDPEVSGLLVPPGDPAALAAGILRVLGDPSLAGRLRVGARERSERWAPDAAVARYEDLLDEVIAR